MTKILIVRFSSIGDIVLTSPIIRCLKNQLKDCEIHYLTKTSFASLLTNNPNIDKIHLIEKDIDEIIPKLKQEKFDYVIDLHRNLRTLRLKQKLGRKSFSFPKLNLEKFLFTRFKLNLLPQIHIVDRYFKAIEALGVSNDLEGLDFYLNSKDEVQELPEEFIAIAIGAKFKTKQIPFDKLQEIIQKATTKIILLGGPEDEETGKALATDDRVTTFCGKLSLGESAYVVSKSIAVLCGDTGLMHIAAAFEKPIISVWGNTTPAFGMYPYMPKNDDLYTLHEVDVKCRPCSKIGYDKCPKGHFKCMNEQDVSKIVDDLNAVLKK